MQPLDWIIVWVKMLFWKNFSQWKKWPAGFCHLTSIASSLAMDNTALRRLLWDTISLFSGTQHKIDKWHASWIFTNLLKPCHLRTDWKVIIFGWLHLLTWRAPFYGFYGSQGRRGSVQTLCSNGHSPCEPALDSSPPSSFSIWSTAGRLREGQCSQSSKGKQCYQSLYMQ